jgi:thiamine-monophosphate kinase
MSSPASADWGWLLPGLAVLTRGFRSPGAVVRAHRVPEPPYGRGVEALRAGATAMIDCSDGLLADLGHIAEESGVTIDVDSAAPRRRRGAKDRGRCHRRG